MFVDGGFRAVAEFLAPRVGRTATAMTERLWALHARDGRGRLFDALLAELGLSPDGDLVLACLLTYRTHDPRLEPFPGVVETLAALGGAGVALGLVSDGQAGVQRRKLAALPAIAALLDVVVLSDDLGAEHWKPSPMPFLVACRLLGLEPGAAAYVGNDPRKDFAGARMAGLRTIRVGRPPDEGGATIERAAPGPVDDADAVVEAFGELPDLLVGPGRPAATRR
jgi:putative hydrolase of the HAD superfamily